MVFSGLGLISIFLPWTTISIFGETQSTNGFHGVGIVVFLSFAAGIIITLMGNQAVKLDKSLWLAALAAGAIALLFIIISFGSSSDSTAMGLVEAGSGIGVWLALISSLGILGTAWFLKNPGDNFKNAFEGAGGSFASESPSGDDKMNQLEKLIEMRNEGKISEDEYRELRSKLI
jgi:hypothetical protein